MSSAVADRRRNRDAPPRPGLTLVELLFVIAVVAVLVGLLLPAVQSARGAARRASCGNQIRQIALAIHGYHAAHRVLPKHGTGTFSRTDRYHGNRNRLSFYVGVLPFMEQQPLYDEIRAGMPGFMPMGPRPEVIEFRPWTVQVATLRCPSDPAAGVSAYGRTNYAACVGDHAFLSHSGGRSQVHAYRVNTTPIAGATGGNPTQNVASAVLARRNNRGFFWPRHHRRFRDLADGTAHTIALGEIATATGDRELKSEFVRRVPREMVSHPIVRATVCLDQADPSRPGFYRPDVEIFAPDRNRGVRWQDFRPSCTTFHTILPPNSPSCSTGALNAVAIASASSRHPGGVHVAMADASVTFITDDIDAGDPTLTPPESGGSPYGVWGSMGTIRGGERTADR